MVTYSHFLQGEPCRNGCQNYQGWLWVWIWEENLNLRIVKSCASVRISTAERAFSLQTGLSTRWNITFKHQYFYKMFFFFPLKNILGQLRQPNGFSGQHSLELFYSSKSKKCCCLFFFFFKEKQVWFEGLKEI